MFLFVLIMALSVIAGIAVIGFVAYPHRGRRVPGPVPVADALDRLGRRMVDAIDAAEDDRVVGAGTGRGTRTSA